MNWKKFWIAFIVLYITGMVLNMIIHLFILGPVYDQLQHIWRQDMDRYMWVNYVTALFYTFFFVYIFAKGYEGKGIMEGVRYGLIIWGFYSIPVTYGQFMAYPIPYSLVWQWLIADLVVLIIIGIVLSLIYKPAEAQTAK